MSTTFRVERDRVERVNPTMGKLYTDEGMYETLEPPWKGNAHDVSCVPTGTYKVIRQMSKRFGRMMPLLLDVPGRTYIEMHGGNEARDTEGCIVVGYRRVSAYTLGYGSRLAFNEFDRWLTSRLEEGEVQVEISYADGSVPS